MVGPPAAAAPFLERLPAGATPAAEAATDARESRPAIRSPSATRGGFDRRKILRRRGDVVGPARGLRVGRQGRGCREQNCDRKTERSAPECAPSAVDLTRPAILVHVNDSQYARRRCVAMPLALMASGGADTDVRRAVTRLAWIVTSIEPVSGSPKERSPGRGRSGALVQ
jgi:hypothetical protein